MNPYLTDENILQQFESYHSRAMDQDSLLQFEEKLNSDQELNEAYRIFKLSREVIEQKISTDLKSQFSQWNKESNPNPVQESNEIALKPSGITPTRQLNKVFRYAAAAAVLFLLTFSFFQYREINQFPDFAITEYQGIKSKSDRGSRVESTVDQIIQDYVNKVRSTDQTVQSLLQISPDVPGIDYFKAQNYLGRLYLLRGECVPMAAAYQISSQLTGYQYDGDIAQVLCALKQGAGRTEVSGYLKKILDQPDHTYFEQAVEIDKKINSLWWSIFK